MAIIYVQVVGWNSFKNIVIVTCLQESSLSQSCSSLKLIINILTAQAADQLTAASTAVQ